MDDSGFEFEIDISGVLGGERPFYELSVAVERGDKAEARLLLERIAADLDGATGELAEQVQQGRFSPETRA